jgi:hypothetical protein
MQRRRLRGLDQQGRHSDVDAHATRLGAIVLALAVAVLIIVMTFIYLPENWK